MMERVDDGPGMSPADLKKLVFISAGEFASLLGPRALEAIGILDRVASTVCPACGGECCRRIGCGFYSPLFGSCPISDYRPAKCRLYFCERVLESPLVGPEEGRILDEPARDLSRYLEYSYGLELFFSPPIRIGEADWLETLGLQEAVGRIVCELNKGYVDPSIARSRLRDLVHTFRREV